MKTIYVYTQRKKTFFSTALSKNWCYVKLCMTEKKHLLAIRYTLFEFGNTSHRHHVTVYSNRVSFKSTKKNGMHNSSFKVLKTSEQANTILRGSLKRLVLLFILEHDLTVIIVRMQKRRV